MKAGFIFNRKVAYGEIGEDDGEMWYCISHAPTQQDFAAIASIMDNMRDGYIHT